MSRSRTICLLSVLVALGLLAGCGTAYPELRQTEWFTREHAWVDENSRRVGRPITGDYGYALWAGIVRERVMMDRKGLGPEFVAVWLKDAKLLAGRSGVDEGDGRVSIRITHCPFPKGEPQPGEVWAFSVQRNTKSMNYARSACKVSDAPAAH